MEDPRFRDLWSDEPGAFCIHLGTPTGETRECDACAGGGGKRKVPVPLYHCALHGTCSRERQLSSEIACCRICPDKRPALAQQNTPQVLTLPPITVRDLIYHVYPLELPAAPGQRGPSVWRKRLTAILSRIDLFNGRRVIAVATGAGTAKFAEVVALARPFGCELFEVANDSRLREAKTLPLLLDRVRGDEQQQKQQQRAIFFGHAKGVTHHAPEHPSHWWAALMEETLLDRWDDDVQKVLSTHPVAGSFKKLGSGCFDAPSASTWHYSGSYFWVRAEALFGKPDWRAKIDQHWWGVETYPSLHFGEREAGCVFHQASASTMNLYSHDYLTNTVLPELQQFRTREGKYDR